MGRKIEFSKMHGLGNDFVMIDNRGNRHGNIGRHARLLGDRHFGIGCDQIIEVADSRRKDADYRMRIYNQDGSEVEMCGNGIRCYAKFLFDRRITRKKTLAVETLAGIIRPEIMKPDGSLVRVNMGEPVFAGRSIPVDLDSADPILGHKLRDSAGRTYSVNCVSMGNPHAVIFVEKAGPDIVRSAGPGLETHPFFPKKTNVEFVEVVDKKTIRVGVWERGAGETLACGTGACAAMVVSHLAGKTGSKVKVRLPGGDLIIEWKEGGPVMMTGPAVEVFRGVINV